MQPLRHPSEHKSAYAHTKSGASNRSNEATEMADDVTTVSGTVVVVRCVKTPVLLQDRERPWFTEVGASLSHLIVAEID